MRILAVWMAAAGLLYAASGDEPSERQMQAAFESALALQIANAVEFAAEAGGTDAIAKIRENRTDFFAVSGFRKIRCQGGPGASGYVCDFQVDIGLANGRLERTITGRFVSGPHGLVFAQDI